MARHEWVHNTPPRAQRLIRFALHWSCFGHVSVGRFQSVSVLETGKRP